MEKILLEKEGDADLVVLVVHEAVGENGVEVLDALLDGVVVVVLGVLLDRPEDDGHGGLAVQVVHVAFGEDGVEVLGALLVGVVVVILGVLLDRPEVGWAGRLEGLLSLYL